MKKKDVLKVLNRPEHKELISLNFNSLKDGERILITGADGSIGTALLRKLNQTDEFLKSKKDITILPTDIEGKHEYLDITNFNNVFSTINKFKPTIIVNLAGAKHAPLGEKETWKTLSINTLGTKHLLDCAPIGCKVILTSTCKSANPEIVYGASKLIAERMVMNAGGSVARYFNVVESSGNVFEIWDELPKNSPIELAPTCERHFISLDEAIGLLFYTMISEPGRYIVNSGYLHKMSNVANRLYPNREKIIIEPRRGDRLTERFLATSESQNKSILNNSIIQLTSIHDEE
tara:strand:- start:1237 stop:2109 length:873 start_codon:yes stop_codon:yes gene_type:complete